MEYWGTLILKDYGEEEYPVCLRRLSLRGMSVLVVTPGDGVTWKPLKEGHISLWALSPKSSVLLIL